MKAKITWRGWPGHFICAERCVFHLNTLIEYRKKKIIVSTVGRMIDYQIEDFRNNPKYCQVGCGRFYETMAFHAKKSNGFWDINVTKQVYFESDWCWEKLEDEAKANDGHNKVVEEIVKKLEEGVKL